MTFQKNILKYLTKTKINLSELKYNVLKNISKRKSALKLTIKCIIFLSYFNNNLII